jgi:Transcriptional regulator, AbiEi antitoxin
MRPKVDTVIARIAERAHGVVTRAELLAAGVTHDEIKHRVAAGALIRVHRGVYRVGHRAPSVEATYVAAVKACGEGAVLSGRAAAHLFGLIAGAPPPPEVTAPSLRRVPGVRTRRSKRIEATRFRGIAVTTIPCILVALAASLSFEDLARACHEASVRYRTRPEHVEPLIGRARGAARLRAILHGDAPIVLSRLEGRFLALLRQHGLPLPKTNRRAGVHYVDCRWPEHGLTVELDSYRFHSTRHAFEQDRRRERAAYARGDQHRRYTYADVFEDPTSMLQELRDLLQCDSDFFRSQGEPHRHGQDHRNRPGHDQLVHGGPRGR